MFGTANTVGLGDTSGLYHGTQQINQGQMDRWNIVTILNYLLNNEEELIIINKVKKLNDKNGKEIKNPFNKFFNNFFSTSGLFVLKK